MSNKYAIITGVTGQDGSYLAEFLLEKNYKVFGLNRRTSLPNTLRIKDILGHPNFTILEFDMSDSISMINIFKKIPNDYDVLEVYNLAAQSHVWTSFYQPEHSTLIDALGPLKLLETIRMLDLKNVRFYQASTSELFGKVQEIPQSELTPFYPRSPYAIAKLYSFWITKNYRESYSIFACNGILFNHESKRRGETFVTRKVTRGLANIAQGLEKCLYMGNIDALRDWGHAKDYVRMQWLMLQQDKPEDFVIATGVQYTVREFIQKSANELGITLQFEGKAEAEKAIVAKIEGDKAPALKAGDVIVQIDPHYYRPTEVETLLGDPTKAKEKLGWVLEITLDQMISEMVAHDLEKAKQHALLKKHGYEVAVGKEK